MVTWLLSHRRCVGSAADQAITTCDHYSDLRRRYAHHVYRASPTTHRGRDHHHHPISQALCHALTHTVKAAALSGGEYRCNCESADLQLQSSSEIRRRRFVVRDSSSEVRRPRFVVRDSSSEIRRRRFVVGDSSSEIRRPGSSRYRKA